MYLASSWPTTLLGGELWDVAMDHVHDLVNHSPESGHKSPVEMAGGQKMDIDDTVECFGSLCYYYEAPERRALNSHQTDPSGRKAIYVGRSTKISRGHRLIPVEMRAGVWHLGPTIDRAYVVFKHATYPLRLVPAKGAV